MISFSFEYFNRARLVLEANAVVKVLPARLVFAVLTVWLVHLAHL